MAPRWKPISPKHMFIDAAGPAGNLSGRSQDGNDDDVVNDPGIDEETVD